MTRQRPGARDLWPTGVKLSLRFSSTVTWRGPILTQITVDVHTVLLTGLMIKMSWKHSVLQEWFQNMVFEVLLVDTKSILWLVSRMNFIKSPEDVINIFRRNLIIMFT